MAVTIDKQVDAVYGGNQIERAVSGTFIVYAKMSQANDEVAAFAGQEVYLRLRRVKHFLSLQESNTLDFIRMRFCHRFRSGEPEHANFQSVKLKNLVCIKDKLSGSPAESIPLGENNICG
jgi:hypothetical protein